MKDYPAPKYPLRHRLPVQIRFNDIDMFGHVNNTVYLEWLDMGKYAYFTGLSDEPFGSKASAPVIANINVDFVEPTIINDRIEVLSGIESIADSSLVLVQRIIAADGRTRCAARTIMVNIDLHTGRPATVDAEWRQRIAHFEQRSL